MNLLDRINHALEGRVVEKVSFFRGRQMVKINLIKKDGDIYSLLGEGDNISISSGHLKHLMMDGHSEEVMYDGSIERGYRFI